MSGVLWDLAAAWFRVGIFGFGGGPSVIPLIRAECVDRYHWLTDAQMLDAIAFGNSLPGPIAVKLAAWVGHQVGGWPGAVVAVTTMSAPGVLLMLALGAAWLRFKDHPVVVGMMRGIRPVAVALLVYTVWTLGPDGLRDTPSILLAVAAFVALLLHVHPAVVVAVGLVVGVLLPR